MAKKKLEETIGIGRRKCAVASVRLRPGKGVINVNGREVENYFPLKIQRETILSPLEKVERLGQYDLVVRVKGGGIEAQAVAIRLGLSRALVSENEELRQTLKGLGYLRRDPRKKERKKYGQPGARKRFQFSKR